MTITEFLTSHSLDVLSAVWERGSDKLQDIVNNRINKQCHFSLDDGAYSQLSEHQLQRLHKFENDNQAWLLQQLFTDKDITPDDSTETKFTTTNNRSATLVFWFGVAITIVSITYVFLITWLPIPEDNLRFADTALGFILGSLLSQVVNFFFGSSMQKTDYHSYTDTRHRSSGTKPPSNPGRSTENANPPIVDEYCTPEVGDTYIPPGVKNSHFQTPDIESGVSELDDVKPNIPSQPLYPDEHHFR